MLSVHLILGLVQQAMTREGSAIKHLPFVMHSSGAIEHYKVRRVTSRDYVVLLSL